jgi:threonine aldolase
VSDRTFASDNNSGVHPEILGAIAAANEGHVTAYGDDPYTAAARDSFRRHFGTEAEAFPVFNGTGANVLALQAMARPHEAVICPRTAHLNEDECGAPERIAGTKLLTVETTDGKLTPELAASRIGRIGEQHAVQPRILSISQATELGTVYTVDEVRALAEFAHERALLLHMDGARLANAACSLGVELSVLTMEAGVDALSFGGTKNGLLLGEAVVFLRPELAEGFDFVRKQSMQLASKMRFISAQLEALLRDDLWRRNAERANTMARKLAELIEPIDGVELAYPVEANAVFVALPGPAIEPLRGELPGDSPFYVWDEERGVVRLMCSWDTTPEDVEAAGASFERVVQSSRA